MLKHIICKRVAFYCTMKKILRYGLLCVVSAAYILAVSGIFLSVHYCNNLQINSFSFFETANCRHEHTHDHGLSCNNCHDASCLLTSNNQTNKPYQTQIKCCITDSNLYKLFDSFYQQTYKETERALIVVLNISDAYCLTALPDIYFSIENKSPPPIHQKPDRYIVVGNFRL